MVRMRGGWRCLAVNAVKFSSNRNEVNENVNENEE